eukprot:3892148-Alexandrium_andersonii.AAC.1
MRKFIKNAGAMVIHQDGRSPRLLTRFTAVTPDLARMSGVLGHIKHYVPGSVGIIAATRKTLTQFCTTGHGAPARDTRKALAGDAAHDPELESHIKNIVLGIDADAASDQQLASRGMHTSIQTFANEAHSLFKNAR